MKRRLPHLLLLVPLSLTACSGEPADVAPTLGIEAAVDSVESFQGRTFERNIVFLTSRPDSVLLVPWLITARSLPGSVRREVRGLLGRADTWEPFFQDRWETPPTRQPWRVLPRGRMRLVVGENDLLDEIVFDEGPRQLSVLLHEPLAEWSGQRGESFRILDGTVVLSSSRVPGLILDMTRSRTAREGSGGDWSVLVAGDSLQIVLHAANPDPPGTPGAFRSWARLGQNDLQWTRVTVEWSETRAFERARREVPSRWSATSAGGDMRAEVDVRTAHLEAGDGEGPQLPVDGLFEVEGTVHIGGDAHAVRGLLRHIQP
jgi:hypothetical protein